MPDARVSPRERLVLTAIIEMYIATGEPVASQAVARFLSDREGLSSATTRNVMATLGEAGLLEQPHTSAGRVPTAAAFRYYVEQITQPGHMATGVQASGMGAVQPNASSFGPSSLSEAYREQIEESFSGVASTNDYLERTCWRCFPVAWALRLPAPRLARCWSTFTFHGFLPAACSPCWLLRPAQCKIACWLWIAN
jgi:heat-inducible transcriptional repressor